MNKPVSLKIRSVHTDLLEAVRAAGIDLSYNEPLALRDIRAMSFMRDAKLGRCYVVLRPDLRPQSYSTVDSNGVVVEVWYELDCDIKLLNKFEAFHACMHDGPFYPTNTYIDTTCLTHETVPYNEIAIHTDMPLRRDRNLIAKWQATGGTRVTLL